MSIKIEGIGAVQAELDRIERKATKAAEGTVKEYGGVIAKQAAKNAPVKDGHLEDSLEILKEEKTTDRYRVTVGVNDEKLGPGYTQNGFDYHAKMHDGEYNLGPRSQTKADSGEAVGPAYLDRAALQHEQAMVDDLIKAIEDAI